MAADAETDALLPQLLLLLRPRPFRFPWKSSRRARFHASICAGAAPSSGPGRSGCRRCGPLLRGVLENVVIGRGVSSPVAPTLCLNENDDVVALSTGDATDARLGGTTADVVVVVVLVVVEEDRGVDDDDMRSDVNAADADCDTRALVSISSLSSSSRVCACCCCSFGIQKE